MAFTQHSSLMPSGLKYVPVQYAGVKEPKGSSMDDVDIVKEDIHPPRSYMAIATMVAALILGALFATAQHLLNDFLNNRNVDGVGISTEWVSRINTALAFLVSACLVTTISVAFIQRQWHHLHHESLRVTDIDVLTGILGNMLHFFGTSIWIRHPLLALIALAAWTIPIASVTTPGSIYVNQGPVTNTTNLQVPQYDWSGTAYSSLPCCEKYGTVVANPTTYRVAFASAMAGKTLSLPSTFQNESYHLTFYGPAIQCGMANSSVTDMISLYQNESQSNPPEALYISWVPGDAESHGLTMANLESKSPIVNLNATYSSLDQTSPDAARIYLFTATDEVRPPVTECVLHNASYDIEFTFEYSEQQQSIQSVQLLNGVSTQMAFPTAGPVNATGQMYASYAGVMDTFGRLLVGYSVNGLYNVEYFQTSYNLLSVDFSPANSTWQGLESLFQNVTLSFLSDSAFTKDSNEAAFVPVAATFSSLIYVYTPWQLWLAYGLSCGVSLICLLIGVDAVRQNGGSYQNSFSTFVRATSHREESRMHIDRSDNCADSLPRGLGNVKVELKGV